MRKRENGFTTPYEMIFLLFFIFWMNESNIIKKGRNTKKFKHNNNKQQQAAHTQQSNQAFKTNQITTPYHIINSQNEQNSFNHENDSATLQILFNNLPTRTTN